MNIPADMIVEQSPGLGTVVSMRDLITLMGASDEQLRDMDEQDAILAREPWRRETVRLVVEGTSPNGMRFGHMEGEIDWSGTRFAKEGKG